MHRHSYRGRKFRREKDQRNALVRGLVCSLFEYQSITTTLARAKEIRPIAERMITRARKGGLANRRLLISRLNDIYIANLLMDKIAPQLKRDSGYLKIERAGFRRGDNTEMATISFVDYIDLDESQSAQQPATKPAQKEEA
ncbi:MAG: 50S ribosomal protein L17 [Candidatus Saccharibacteria bacterium]|nr:50S ribosomal protein L17 [Candidatus Saccharibacteria bacterium]